MRLWIDTDVGDNVDDAVALLAAVAHPAIELAGVSTVGSDPERRAAVAAGLLSGAGVDLGAVPVVPGAPGPVQAGSAEAAVAGAVEVVEAVAASGADALLAIGPLTNVAALTAAGARPPEVTIMGGALQPVEHRGRLMAVEHNFGSDPEAAAAVLAVDGTVVVPLDATIATRLDDRMVTRLVGAAPVLEPMISAWRAGSGEIVLHDPAALLVAAGDGPELGRFERRRLLVDPDGRLVDGGRGASGTVHDVVTSLFGVAVVASVLALLSDLKIEA